MYAQNLIQIAGSPAHGLGETDFKITTIQPPLTAGAGIANIINVAVMDMKLYLNMAHIYPDSIPRSYTMYMKQFSPFVRQLQNGNNNSFTIDLKQWRRISHIAIAFINKSNEAFHYSPCDFSSGFTAYNNANPPVLQNVETYNTTNQIANLYQVYITFAGVKYPMNDYTLLMTNNNGLSNDLSRAWYDYLVASDSLRDRAGNLLDFKSWQVTPIFLWKTFQDIKTTNNTINVTINVRQIQNPNYNSNANVLVCGLYDEYYNLVFDDKYRVTDEKLDATPIGVHD